MAQAQMRLKNNPTIVAFQRCPAVLKRKVSIQSKAFRPLFLAKATILINRLRTRGLLLQSELDRNIQSLFGVSVSDPVPCSKREEAPAAAPMAAWSRRGNHGSEPRFRNGSGQHRCINTSIVGASRLAKRVNGM